MKQYISLSAAVASVLLMGSCSLEENNFSAVSTDAEWKTAAGFEKLVNSCYMGMVRQVYGQAEDTYIIGSEGGTDIWQDVSGSGNWKKALTYEGFDASVSMFLEAYQGFYNTLNECNAAIKYAELVEGLSQDQINKLVAEAHFLRAHALYSIVEQYGGKYLATVPTAEPITSLTCSTVNEFYDVILADLEFAIQNLPVKQDVYGHVTRAAAYHQYAKACLSYGTYTDADICALCNAQPISEATAKDLFTKAKNAAEELINNASTYGVALYDEADEVFCDGANKQNKEAVFRVCHSTIQALNPRGNYYNRAWKHYCAYNNNTSGIYLEGIEPTYNPADPKLKLAKGNCYMCPTEKFLALYGEKDSRYEAYFTTTYYVNKANKNGHYEWTSSDCKIWGLADSRVGNADYNLEIGDTAIYISRKPVTQAERDACHYALYNLADNYANPKQPKKFFPSCKKGNEPSLYAGSNASKPYTSGDCIIYRLSEAYLMASEACWRLGDNTNALKHINVIRNRACIGHDHSMDLTAIDKDALLDEYAMEMVGEWNRWFTLKRFRAFESRLAAFNPQNAPNWKKEYYVRPINTSEILNVLNADEYQNQGY